MRGNTIDYSQARRISESTYISWTRRLVPSGGDLLFAREAPVGPIVLIPDSENIAPGQRTMLMRPNPTLADSRFLYYLLSSPAQQDQLQSLAGGSTVAHLNVADVRTFPLDVPPLEDQRAIAEVLGALDDKIAVNDRIASSALVLASTIYGHQIAGRPERPMSDVLTPILGGTPARSESQFWTGTNLWASARDVTGADHGVIVETLETISDSAIHTTKARSLPAGSVILTARGTVGAVARLGVASSFNQSCYGFEPGHMSASVLYFAILNATERAKAFAHGSVFDTITMKTFGHLLVPDLPRGELDAIEARINPLLKTVDLAVRENQTLAATRDALLPQLMSGKLRVKDAEKALAGVL
ncbi:restriction endonuclease subunit S [Cryobacterium sp. Y57]|uniref:restriction endonuclease subunit S n=1 Tax=Cryobacterium sp. Y57 TaxID=2048287 RepID=UPI001E622D6D|nr:restriction endonuclease subunit S [Cryobacterium sp. Y57]